MYIEKENLYSEIERLPDNITIKSKKDLKEKLQKGLEDIKNNKVYSLNEVLRKIENI